MRKTYEQAFLDGYKPAILILKTNQLYDQIKDYPHITPFNNHPESCIFFQTDCLKQEYQQRIKGVKLFSPAYHFIVGTTLGFPLRSVEFFAKMRKLDEGSQKEYLDELYLY